MLAVEGVAEVSRPLTICQNRQRRRLVLRQIRLTASRPACRHCSSYRIALEWPGAEVGQEGQHESSISS
jgi:hypothetical protein